MSCSILLKEYFKNKEYTDEVLVDGWFNTGDKGYIDENGFLHITGRVKDIFKTSKGKYIEPHLIEEKFEKSIEKADIRAAALMKFYDEKNLDSINIYDLLNCIYK